jgi:hypothetical protein
MKAGWIGSILFIWVIALLLGSIPVGANLLEDTSVTSVVQSSLSFTQVWNEQDWGTLVNPLHWPQFAGDIWNMALLKLPLFGDSDSPYQLVRWVVLAPIIATVVFALVLLFISILNRNA